MTRDIHIDNNNNNNNNNTLIIIILLYYYNYNNNYYYYYTTNTGMTMYQNQLKQVTEVRLPHYGTNK